jgi:glycopeptide antibiotics resistance protein
VKTASRLRIKSKSGLTLQYRWQVASRTLAAMLGGFLLTSAFSILLAHLLMRGGLLRPDAVATSTLLSFAVWCGLVLWAYQTRSVRRVWLNMLAPALAMGLLAWLIRPGVLP